MTGYASCSASQREFRSTAHRGARFPTPRCARDDGITDGRERIPTLRQPTNPDPEGIWPLEQELGRIRRPKLKDQESKFVFGCRSFPHASCCRALSIHWSAKWNDGWLTCSRRRRSPRGLELGQSKFHFTCSCSPWSLYVFLNSA